MDVLIIVGDQVPCTPFVEVVGKLAGVLFWHIAGIGANVDAVGLWISTITSIAAAH